MHHCFRIYRFLILAFLIPLFSGCTAKKIELPEYTEFASLREQALPRSVQEVYGRFTATSSGKSVRSTFNMLLDPGKNVYLEVQNPSGQLIYVLALDSENVTLLWAKDGSYLEEPANANTIEAITGFPILPDDLMMLAGGFGLDFSKWQVSGARKDGWNLVRDQFQGQLFLQENLSKIAITTEKGSRLLVKYEEYQMMNDRNVPTRIRFELPDRKIFLELSIDKYLPRSEPASTELFSVQLPKGAHLLTLSDIYEGKPLLFNQ
jgi:outer membrane biogenesis lipoprotein LolB